MKIKLLLFLLMISSLSFATEKALVILVRGHVTKLPPGASSASKIVKGETLVEETSIVTRDKSVLRLRFSDKSSLTLGPNSKLIVEKIPAKKANVVNLLNGMIKAQVNKKSDKKSKNKMIVKTKTAVMGVRGTKFQTIYNPVNKATSLITVEGRVAMARTKVQDVLVAKNIDAVLETSSAVEVPAGRYAGVIKNVEKPTVPVKIAPKQYDMMAKSMGSEKRASEVMKPLATDPAPEGYTSKWTGKFAPKAGGVIDYQTGLYLPPTKDAPLDQTTGTYEVTKNMGSLDTNTGDFIPPKGIKVDPNKGFVVDTKDMGMVASNDDGKQLESMVMALNEEVIANKMVGEKKDSKPWKIVKEHVLSFEFRPYSEKLNVKNKASGSDAKFFTKSADLMILTWKQVWSEKWSSVLKIGEQNYELDDSDFNYYDHKDDSGYFSVGAIYSFNKMTTIHADLISRSHYYVTPGHSYGYPDDGHTDENVNFNTQEVELLNIGIKRKLYTFEKISLFAAASINLAMNAEAPGEEGSEGSDLFGLDAELNGIYSWKKNLKLNTSLWFSKMSEENDSYEFERDTIGLGLQFLWHI